MHWFLNFLFGNETLYVSDSSSVHRQELFTVHWAMLYAIQLSRSRIGMVPSWSCCCSKSVYKPVWHIPLLSVQWIIPDDGQRNCSKHIEFHFQKEIWGISASSWFYYKEICHDARSHVTMHGHRNLKFVNGIFPDPWNIRHFFHLTSLLTSVADQL
jgi:hypothetical protein